MSARPALPSILLLVAVVVSGAAGYKVFVADRGLSRAFPIEDIPVDDWEEISSGGLSIGDPEAPVTAVYFIDMTCPYSRAALLAMGYLHSRYGDEVRSVVRHFPLMESEISIEGAAALQCAARGDAWYPTALDLVWRMQDSQVFFEEPFQMTAAVGSTEEWSDCLNDPSIVAEVRRDRLLGEHLGVSGTPTVILNGRVMSPLGSMDAFEAEIRRHIIDAESSR